MLSIQNTNVLGGESKVLFLFGNVEGEEYSVFFLNLKADGTYSYHCACVMHRLRRFQIKFCGLSCVKFVIIGRLENGGARVLASGYVPFFFFFFF